MKKICIITTRHISYNPRVLKEADALTAAGYEVSVVTINNQMAQRQFDEELMRTRNWKLRTVDFRRGVSGEHGRWMYLSIRQRLFGILSRLSLGGGVAERVAEKAFDGLARLAKAEKADLYIVHHAEALGAGFRAAKHNKAKLGFDAEDFHTGMRESSVPGPEDVVTEYLERKYLRHCDYLTAASKGIAEAYGRKYGIRTPEVLLNVFPLERLSVEEVHEPVRFYWYSQVIGPNRGLELLLEAAGRVGGDFEVHLRGSLYSEEFKGVLKSICDKAGIWDKIYFHEPILAGDIIRDAVKYDVGMALESDVSVNRNICVTNKVFSYLMSGLLIIGTDTEGQKDIFRCFPDATGMCRMNDPEDLARVMRAFLHDRSGIMKAKTAARRAASEVFNWELESKKLVANINQLFTL